MRMWVSLACAAAVMVAIIVAWAARDAAPRRVRSSRTGTTDRDPPAPPAGQLPGSSAPAKKSSLDGKVVFHPVELDGSRTGCRIEFRTPENGLARTGLRDGDDVVEVDGEAMSIRMALGLIHRLEEASLKGLDLTILRDGQTQHVTARIGQ